MRQQVNLHQPILREDPKLFGARAAARSFVVVVVALVAISAFGAFKVRRLESATLTLRDQQVQQEESLSATSTMSAARATPMDLAARVKRAELEVVGRTRALELLRAGAAGRTTGFAARLEALARRHVEGVWIDRMALSGSTDAMSLGGATFTPDLVPQYLENLSREEVLSGARFDQLSIERPRDNAQVKFRASSLMLPEQVASEEEGGTT